MKILNTIPMDFIAVTPTDIIYLWEYGQKLEDFLHDMVRRTYNTMATNIGHPAQSKVTYHRYYFPQSMKSTMHHYVVKSPLFPPTSHPRISVCKYEHTRSRTYHVPNENYGNPHVGNQIVYKGWGLFVLDDTP